MMTSDRLWKDYRGHWQTLRRTYLSKSLVELTGGVLAVPRISLASADRNGRVFRTARVVGLRQVRGRPAAETKH